MKSRVDLKKLLRGYVRLENEAGEVVEGRNLVVYTGGDIIAQLLTGNLDYQITHMYFGYENTLGVPSKPAASRTDTAASIFHALVAPDDFLRAPILQPVTLEAADVNHSFNRATFNAVANGSAGVLGLDYGAAFNSKVWGVALVASPGVDYTGDWMYAYYVLPTALPAAGTGQVSATWATEAD